ncbi:MAG: HIT domain-containing protein [Chloroflexi bacterium]|nr:HIT domain-containing protein [Chloroflexota bacterium]
MDNIDFNCIFCAIVARRAPAAMVYENDGALAFLDINPVTQGHTLVIPKKHCRNVFDIDDASGTAVMHASRVVARALRAAFHADGLTILQSNERAGGQAVFHYHAHLAPRFTGDGLMSRNETERRLQWRARAQVSRQELDAIAEQIRAQIKDD